jgi:hypothetical protein
MTYSSMFFSTNTIISSSDISDKTRLLTSYTENMFGRSYGILSKTSARPAPTADGLKLQDIILMAFSNNSLFPSVLGTQYLWTSLRNYLVP